MAAYLPLNLLVSNQSLFSPEDSVRAIIVFGLAAALVWAALSVLVLLYMFTPLKIEWIGLVVVGIYAAVYGLVFQRRRQLSLKLAG